MENSTKGSENYKKLRDDAIDIGIIAKGFVSVYYNDDILNYDIKLLENKKYKILEIEGNYVSDDKELRYDVQETLRLHDVAHSNHDSLSDCLDDFAIDENGVVIVFRNLKTAKLLSFHMLLDVLAVYAREEFAAGRRMIILVHVDNPKFKIDEPIAPINFKLWNDKEWFEGDRKK